MTFEASVKCSLWFDWARIWTHWTASKAISRFQTPVCSSRVLRQSTRHERSRIHQRSASTKKEIFDSPQVLIIFCNAEFIIFVISFFQLPILPEFQRSETCDKFSLRARSVLSVTADADKTSRRLIEPASLFFSWGGESKLNELFGFTIARGRLPRDS